MTVLLLVSIPFLSKYQETLRILEISICKYDKVLCLSWCGNIFEVHFKTGTLILFDDISLDIILGRVSGDGCWVRAGLHIGWHDSWHAECWGEGKLLKFIFHNWIHFGFHAGDPQLDWDHSCLHLHSHCSPHLCFVTAPKLYHLNNLKTFLISGF